MTTLLNNPKLRPVWFFVAALGFATFAWFVYSQFGNSAAAATADRVFVDAQTGQTFQHTLKIGETQPVEAPSGGKTGYEAEPCYWTADGGGKPEPTWVLPQVKVDPTAGPTFCPDCGRLVTPRNPQPGLGITPPPTKAEYDKRRGGEGGNGNNDKPAAKEPAPVLDREGRPVEPGTDAAPAAPAGERRR